MAGCPGFSERFSAELRPLVPDDYALGVHVPPVSGMHCVHPARSFPRVLSCSRRTRVLLCNQVAKLPQVVTGLEL